MNYLLAGIFAIVLIVLGILGWIAIFKIAKRIKLKTWEEYALEFCASALIGIGLTGILQLILI